MILTIDFETRSPVDIRAHGAYVYAEHEKTEVLCLAVKEDDKPTRLWVPDKFRCGQFEFHTQEYWDELKAMITSFDPLENCELGNLLYRASMVYAHNANFERCIWREKMAGAFGDIPLEKWRCTAAMAAALALPRDLGSVCQVLGMPEQKDMGGHNLMLKMCKPRKLTALDYRDWHDDVADLKALYEYCIQDVEAERALAKRLEPLSLQELNVWRLDQIINDRGIRVDIGTIDNICIRLQEYEEMLLREMKVLTEGAITSPRQVQATLDWLEKRGVCLENLQAATVADALEWVNDPKMVGHDPVAARVLEIRQALALASTKKFQAMARFACRDGRARGSLLYHGASTGRWAGRGIQPQNFPRYNHEHLEEEVLEAIQSLSVQSFLEGYGCLNKAASGLLRACLCASEDSTLVCADFSSIEARVLAWLAGEQGVLDAFRKGLDLYKVAASQIYRVNYDDVDKPQRQVGKTAILACGYQGAVGAFQMMGKTYGVEVSDEDAAMIVQQWRQANPRIVRYWYDVEDAAMNAVRTGQYYRVGHCVFGTRGKFLYIRLPSGRRLAYYDPRVEERLTPVGMREVLCFMGMNSFTHQWSDQTTYGGKLVENITQGVARDFMAEAMLRAHRAKYPLVLTVHDEMVAEVEEYRHMYELTDGPDVMNKRELDAFTNIMALLPAWAKGCPISAEGWVGRRYRK